MFIPRQEERKIKIVDDYESRSLTTMNTYGYVYAPNMESYDWSINGYFILFDRRWKLIG